VTEGVAETALNPADPKDDYTAKRQALQDLEREPGHDAQAVRQRKLDLEKEARAKGVVEGNPAPASMRQWIVQHDGSHGEGGTEIIDAPNAETAWEIANEYDLDIISIKPHKSVDEDRLKLNYKRNRFKSLHKMSENAEELNIGDPVIISGKGIEFEGKTGNLYSFGDNKRFVIVDLYNYGKHSFHSSDVSYNEYADEDEVDESMYQYDKEDPYNSEFAPDVGMGRMTLRGWKQSLARRVAQLSQEMEQSTQGGSIDQAALWDNVYRKMQALNLDPIAQEIELAHQELERIRRQGGTRSRAFK
jgi:hypothetical protein